MASPNSNQSGADFDLSQFYGIFFEEAAENLDLMEQTLLSLDITTADDEALNGIFRCAHSVKGGAATFSFADVAELTHHMESLLDRLRRHEIEPNADMVDVLLESADVSRSLLARHQAGGEGPHVETADLVKRISALAEGKAAPAKEVKKVEVVQEVKLEPVVSASGERSIEIHIGPLDNLALADSVAELFRDIPGLGTINQIESGSANIRAFAVETKSSDADLLDLFEFHVSRSIVKIIPKVNEAQLVKPQPAVEVAQEPVVEVAPKASAETPKPANKAAAASNVETASIRVPVNKVDQLINLVGELVITQAMLAQNSLSLDQSLNQGLLAGLTDLERNTRDLQESVMSIRMMPMSTVFSRFPRMLRDLASKLNKKVEFVTKGEATELDKGLVEKIIDPLTHLVRNSCDHGIEQPDVRKQKGKPETGTITLSAAHQGGSIVIEVRDDGAGMSRERILSKARERGMNVSDSMPDSEVWMLIFEPGFSTAEAVTDISGRGVGMDVVKRNIAALNGVVNVESVAGQGMCVSVRLPLTLAIMDGMSVGVRDEIYILPLSSVVESFQLKTGDVSTLGQGAKLIKVREEYMPMIALKEVFEIPPTGKDGGDNLAVVIEVDGVRVALLVDELLGQQQVVVKNLETNYRKVANISGATILGDGRVALILDTLALVGQSKNRGGY